MIFENRTRYLAYVRYCRALNARKNPKFAYYFAWAKAKRDAPFLFAGSFCP